MGKKKNGSNGTPVATKPRKPAAPYRDRAAKAIKRASAILAKLVKKIGKLPSDWTIAQMTIPDYVAGTIEDFKEVTGLIESLPADWKPARSARGEATAVAVGDFVQVRDASAKKYTDVFTADAKLEVKEVRAALLGIKLPDGATTLVTRAHFKKVPAAPTPV